MPTNPNNFGSELHLVNRVEELERQSKNANDEIQRIKYEFENLKQDTRENVNIVKEISLQNARFSVILENNVEISKDTRRDMKELRELVGKINMDTSKNTDTRLTNKQIIVSLIISILMLFIGAGLAKSGFK